MLGTEGRAEVTTRQDSGHLTPTTLPAVVSKLLVNAEPPQRLLLLRVRAVSHLTGRNSSVGVRPRRSTGRLDACTVSGRQYGDRVPAKTNGARKVLYTACHRPRPEIQKTRSRSNSIQARVRTRYSFGWGYQRRQRPQWRDHAASAERPLPLPTA